MKIYSQILMGLFFILSPILALANGDQAILTVAAPNGFTFAEYVHQVAKNLPDLGQDYEWIINVQANYSVINEKGIFQSYWPIKTLSCDVKNGFGMSRQCLATSEVNSNNKEFTWKFERTTDLLGNPMPLGEAWEFNYDVELMLRPKGDYAWRHRLILSPVLPSFIYQSKYDPAVFKYHSDGVLGNSGIITCAYDSTEERQNFYRPRFFTLNSTIAEVLKTNCCSYRGEWMQLTTYENPNFPTRESCARSKGNVVR